MTKSDARKSIKWPLGQRRRDTRIFTHLLPFPASHPLHLSTHLPAHPPSRQSSIPESPAASQAGDRRTPFLTRARNHDYITIADRPRRMQSPPPRQTRRPGLVSSHLGHPCHLLLESGLGDTARATRRFQRIITTWCKINTAVIEAQHSSGFDHVRYL